MLFQASDSNHVRAFLNNIEDIWCFVVHRTEGALGPLTCNMIVRTWNAKKVKTQQFHDHYSISLQEYQCMLLIQISFGIGFCPCGCGYAYASSTGQESLGLSSYTWIEFESEFKVREKEHKCNACGGWVWLTGPGGWCGIGFVRKLASGSSRLWPNLVSSSS